MHDKGRMSHLGQLYFHLYHLLNEHNLCDCLDNYEDGDRDDGDDDNDACDGDDDDELGDAHGGVMMMLIVMTIDAKRWR